MVGLRFEVEVPRRNLGSLVLILLALDEAMADVADVRLVPGNLARVGRQVRLDVL
jgi:hypothetical protein